MTMRQTHVHLSAAACYHPSFAQQSLRQLINSNTLGLFLRKDKTRKAKSPTTTVKPQSTNCVSVHKSIHCRLSAISCHTHCCCQQATSGCGATGACQASRQPASGSSTSRSAPCTMHPARWLGFQSEPCSSSREPSRERILELRRQVHILCALCTPEPAALLLVCHSVHRALPHGVHRVH